MGRCAHDPRLLLTPSLAPPGAGSWEALRRACEAPSLTGWGGTAPRWGEGKFSKQHPPPFTAGNTEHWVQRTDSKRPRLLFLNTVSPGWKGHSWGDSLEEVPRLAQAWSVCGPWAAPLPRPGTPSPLPCPARRPQRQPPQPHRHGREAPRPRAWHRPLPGTFHGLPHLQASAAQRLSSP